VTAIAARLRSAIAKRAARAAVRHSARGIAAKLRRRPVRTARLLGAGAAVGAAAGWLAGRLRRPG
jgi:hypothetical protein